MALALAGGHAAQGHSEEHADAATMSEQRLAFHDEMRRLWEDHITWTRLFIVSASADLPDAPATRQRLLENQEDIGNAIKPFYGRAAGELLTALLREHILGAADLLAAAKAGDQAARRTPFLDGPGKPGGSAQAGAGGPGAGRRQSDQDSRGPGVSDEVGSRWVNRRGDGEGGWWDEAGERW